MITVAELIGELMKFPGGCRVVVRGYESGFNDAGVPEQIELDLNHHNPEDWFFGSHAEARGGSPAVLIKANAR
ncbi:hypothetical protein ABIF26_006484 [Bradyrhizobium elkanii]|nr:hypothetical protein [Bradyrhizobium elkanii]